MAGGTPIQQFNDFMKTTGPVFLDSIDKVVNNAAKHTYVFSRFLKGRGMDEVVSSGTEIREDIFFDELSTARHVLPNETLSWSNPQVLEQMAIQWRFTLDYMTWTEQELELNGPGSNSTRAFRKSMYKRLKKSKEQRFWTSVCNFLEESLFRVPVGATYGAAQMEGNAGRQPFSLYAITNEETNGLYTGWTTKQGLNPATFSDWQPQTETYDKDDILNDTTTGLLRGFDDLALKCKFVPPDTKEEYFEGYDPKRIMWLCSRTGLNNYAQALRVNNDTMVNKTDPHFAGPSYHGAPVIRASQMELSAAYDNGTATEDNATVPHPRYLYVDGSFMKPIFHDTHYFQKGAPMRHINQPYTWVQPTDLWWNLACTSIQRQGILSPVA